MLKFEMYLLMLKFIEIYGFFYLYSFINLKIYKLDFKLNINLYLYIVRIFDRNKLF